MVRLPFLAFALSLVSGAGHAQTLPPIAFDQPAECLCGDASGRAALLDELETLVRAAERYQAADPLFLEDLNRFLSRERLSLQALREIEAMQDAAAPDVAVPSFEPAKIFLSDNFSDGDYSQGTAWAVRQGAWIIDPEHGLRMAPLRQASEPALTIDDLVAAILSGQPPALPDASPATEPGQQAALIEAQQPVDNAFDLRAVVRDHAGTGAAHFLIHQSGREWPGYRLEMIPGAQPILRLARRGRDGYLDLAVSNAPALSSGQPVAVRWRRDRDGLMTVSLNGELVLEARDITFQGDWNGFIFFNARGDVSLREIDITTLRP